MTPPAGLANPADFAGALAGVPASNSLRERADAIHKAGLGSVLTYADGKETPVKELTADAFWKALNEGGEWKGDSCVPRRRAQAVPQPVPRRLPSPRAICP